MLLQQVEKINIFGYYDSPSLACRHVYFVVGCVTQANLSDG